VVKRPALHGIILFAPDLRLAREFYSEVLGFTVVRETDSHLALGGAGFQLAVFRCETSTSPEGYSTRR
jgi:catechol 2,3-dioxygenase-like lactoylglutathione lyase family enzyme